MPTDGAGDVLMDYLPAPVLGTFWPYSADKAATLTSVTASRRRVRVERTALTLPELLEANPGADVKVLDSFSATNYSAQIVGVPQRSSDEAEADGPPSSSEQLPQKGSLILLKTAEGVSALPLDRIQTAAFKGDYKPTLASEEFRSLLTLHLDWHQHAPTKTANVGMMYLQKGIRWIPSYKITIDGQGHALVKLQATLINEMTDLQDVTAHLVIGVPTFAFAGQPDPIGIGQTMAQLSPYFSRDADTAYGFSNAVMTQAAPNAYFRLGADAPADTGSPAVANASKNEDLYVFSVKHVTLAKGQRMVLPVAEYPLKYKDVYTLDLPFAPPPEMRQNYNSDQQGQLAHLLSSPKVMHKLRFDNDCEYPLTTAPALILKDDRVIAQGLMTYTAVNSSVDLELTTALDIKAHKTDRETGRTPNVETWQGNAYSRINLTGAIHLANYGTRPIDLEVTRQVLGHVGTADAGGVAEMLNTFEPDDDAVSTADYPSWWGWGNWPGGWTHFNGIGRIKWTLTLAPGKTSDLGYTWSYVWQ